MASIEPEKGKPGVSQDGTTTNITTDGSVVQSNDPSTRPDATLGQKLAGDAKGAVHGAVGSVQAATGTVLGNKEMQAQGLSKMQEEDERLGVKHGVMPVGSGLREDATGNPTTKPVS